ncbi:zinc-dependent alcohol dehydrogenase family protein [Aerophototrophica crusticola]|uniref:Zinc-dependent alcohol dehydrogenase family protein n=1 Tax=Aerophototrophica crusticola TaxID=1709002 RepID=A0A858R9D0_9PROT|nr:zinc-dependent alcohol dehydrogenase family protein [Rhodospirillaceae bacterium B3]
MKAILLNDFGDVSNFQPADLPTPVAGPGQVLVKVAAASVNPVDIKNRSGGRAIAPELPGVLGCDMAGVVEAVGEGVSGLRPGDRVYGCVGGVKGMPGTYAEYVAADARLLAPAPGDLSLREAAALPLVFITAWEGLVDRAQVKRGDTVLVHGGAGGVGHVAIQIAKEKGARVVATVSSAEKGDLAKSFGADEVVNYREETVEQYVARLTEGRGFDIVFDATGGKDIATSFAAARLNGQVVTIVSMYEADLSPMHLKGLSLHVVFMLIPMLHDTPAPLDRSHHGWILRRAAEMANAGHLKPHLDPTRFTLDQVAEAHTHLESGKAVGKVVVDVAGDLVG